MAGTALSLALWWLVSPGFAASPRLDLRLEPDRVKQGGVSVLTLEGPDTLRSWRVEAGGREVPVLPSEAGEPSRALIGVDLDQPPGDLAVRVHGVDGQDRPVAAQVWLRVQDARFPVQRLTLPRRYVELDAATLERVAREQAVLDRVWTRLTTERLWRGPFRLPLDDAGAGTGFGQRRIINGEPRAPHTGIDFAAPAGSTVLASNAGMVALVADHFFSGTSIILDHGLGLYTMYFHLQESLALPGQRVSRGQPIGRVGSSGRATGPHLHWGARLHGTRIDPQELVHLVHLP